MTVLDPVYPDAIHLEASLTGTSSAYDISGDLISTIHGEYGFNDTTYLDRVAPPGSITFLLKNVDHQYLFGLSSTLAGWQKGIRIQAAITFQGSKQYVISGFLKDCAIDEPLYGVPTVRVTATTWMEKASNFPLEKMQVLTNSKIADGVQAILNKMPIPPSSTALGVGVDTLPTIFDATQVNTNALTEFQRLALSEFGYIYERMQPNGGEQLVVEGRGDRTSSKTYPTIHADSTYLLTDPNGFILLAENGTPILLNNTQSAPSLAYMTVNIESGENLLNKVSARVYPRRVDTSNQTLFTLQQSIFMDTLETKTNIRGLYTDPNGGGTKVTADPSTMVALVAGTHYRMTANQDGTGADRTDALKINYTFGAEGITFNSLQNTGTNSGWIVTLKAQGKGTYLYEPIDYIPTGSIVSQANVGILALNLDQKYQSQIDTGAGLVDLISDRESSERTRIRKMYFNANTNSDQMYAFLDLEIGDLVPIVVENPPLSDDYIINRKEFDIELGGVINYAFEYVEFLPLVSDYWQLETVGFSELGVSTYVGL